MSKYYRENGKFFKPDFSNGLTSQSFREDADINNIIKRFTKSGQLPPMRGDGQPFYGDVSEFSGLADALIKVQEAQDLFMQFPANVRERFENDPVQLIEFLGDEKNRSEAEALGLVQKKAVPDQPKPPAVTPPTA